MSFQYFGYLMWRVNSLEKTLKLRKIEGKKRRGWQKMKLLDSITDLMNMSLSKLWELVKDKKVWHTVVHGVMKNQTWLSDWTTTKPKRCLLLGRKAMTNLDNDHKEDWALKNWCFWTVVLEKASESPFDNEEIKPVNLKGNQPCHWKDWYWSWRSNTLSTWCEESTHWKRPWCWERLRAGGEGDVRGWDCWMASPTRWTWIWASSGSWWTGKPGMLQSMGCQRFGHDWANEVNWTELNWVWTSSLF